MSFIIDIQKPTRPGAAARIVITPKLEGKALTDQKTTRELGPKATADRAAELVHLLGAGDDLIDQIRALAPTTDVDDEDEPIRANATQVEIEAVEAMVERWSAAVGQAYRQGLIAGNTAATYRQHVTNFRSFVRGEFEPGARGRRAAS